MVVLEAMSRRLPVVATPVAASTRRHGETGLQVPLRDPGRSARDPAAPRRSGFAAQVADAAFERASAA
jgi:hypothetical protein